MKYLSILFVFFIFHNLEAQQDAEKCLTGKCKKGFGREIFYDPFFDKMLMYEGEFIDGERNYDAKLYEKGSSGTYDKYFLSARYIDDRYVKTLVPNEGKILSFNPETGIGEQLYYDHHWQKLLRYHGRMENGKRNGLGMLYQQSKSGKYDQPFILAEFTDGNIYFFDEDIQKTIIKNALFFPGSIEKYYIHKPLKNDANLHPDSKLETLYHLYNSVFSFGMYDDSLLILSSHKNLQVLYYNHYIENDGRDPFYSTLNFPLDPKMGACVSENCSDEFCEITNNGLKYMGECKNGLPHGMGLFVNRNREGYWINSVRGVPFKIRCASLHNGISRKYLSMQKYPVLVDEECLMGNCINGEGLMFRNFGEHYGALHANFDNKKEIKGTYHTNKGLEISGDFTKGLEGEYDLYVTGIKQNIKGIYKNAKLIKTSPSIGLSHGSMVNKYRDSVYTAKLKTLGYRNTDMTFYTEFSKKDDLSQKLTKEVYPIRKAYDKTYALIFYPEFTDVEMEITLYMEGGTLLHNTGQGYVEKEKIKPIYNGENAYAEFKFPEKYIGQEVHVYYDIKVAHIPSTFVYHKFALNGLLFVK